MLKYIRDNLDGLDAATAAMYKLGADGKYTLQLEGLPAPEDTGPLKRALDAEKAQRLAATQRVTALETENTSLKAGTPVADLEKSWQLKLDTQAGISKARESQLLESARKTLVDSTALQIATDLSKVPHLLVPHVVSKLTVLEENGTFVVKVLGDDGKPSATTVKEFSDKLVADPTFAPIMIASKASGGGASGGGKAGGAKPWKDMTEADKTALYRKDPTEFRRLRDAAKSSQAA